MFASLHPTNAPPKREGENPKREDGILKREAGTRKREVAARKRENETRKRREQNKGSGVVKSSKRLRKQRLPSPLY
jgi:hypothetical protein